MRLAKVTVEGFRGLPAAEDFDLDADAVVIVGANGSGKTSLLDAVLWALTGRLVRVEHGGGSVRSGFAPDSETRVALTLRGEGDVRFQIIRSQLPDEKEPRLTVDDGSGPRRGVAAEVELLGRVWPNALDAAEASQAMGGALTAERLSAAGPRQAVHRGRQRPRPLRRPQRADRGWAR
jgi:AAA domain